MCSLVDWVNLDLKPPKSFPSPAPWSQIGPSRFELLSYFCFHLWMLSWPPCILPTRSTRIVCSSVLCFGFISSFTSNLDTFLNFDPSGIFLALLSTLLLSPYFPVGFLLPNSGMAHFPVWSLAGLSSFPFYPQPESMWLLCPLRNFISLVAVEHSPGQYFYNKVAKGQPGSLVLLYVDEGENLAESGQRKTLKYIVIALGPQDKANTEIRAAEC